MAERSAHIDPAEARAFAQDLRGVIDYYSRVIDRLESNVSRLSKTWRDRQFEEFREEVNTLRRGLAEYIKQSESAGARLGHLATHAEEFQKIQLR